MADYTLNPNGMTDSSAEFRAVTNSIINAIQDLDASAKAYAEMNQGERSRRTTPPTRSSKPASTR